MGLLRAKGDVGGEERKSKHVGTVWLVPRSERWPPKANPGPFCGSIKPDIDFQVSPPEHRCVV